MPQDKKPPHTDNDDDTPRKVIPVEEFLRRLERSAKEPAAKDDDDDATSPPPEPAPDLSQSMLAALAANERELTAYFALMADDNNKGLKVLKGNPRFQIMLSVWNNDLKDFWVHQARTPVTDMNRRWYWHFPGKPKDVRFVTPAHLVRSHLMAVNLNNHKVDFKMPDSDGRLPLHYIARHGRDPWLIPYLVTTHHVDPHDGGHCTNDDNLAAAKGSPYRDPLMRAIAYGNMHSLAGFMLADRVNLTQARDNYGQTPLMFAAQEAADAANRLGPSARETLRRTWIMRELAAEPHVDITPKDIAGNDAATYAALHPAVKAAFDQGVSWRTANAQRDYFIRRHMPRPQTPQP